jgi:hypothetical protein
MATLRPTRKERPVPIAAAREHRWLLFVHQLPSTPSNLRVRTWRRLQQIGALPVKNALYVLPDTPSAREDFEWLKTEIETAGGQASVFAADAVDAWSNDSLVEEFRRTREAAYTELAREAEKLLKGRARVARAIPRKGLQQIKERLAALEQIDFFGSAGRDRVLTLVHQLESRGEARTDSQRPKTGVATEYRRRLWVTRPRPGVDRMASAWLIRRFVDPEAQFGFAADRGAVPTDGIPFDMFGVDFTHRGDLCTFEMMCDTFSLDAPGLKPLGAIVHDLDFKDARFGAAEASTVGLVIDGLRLAYADDQMLLNEGIVLFDALYRALEQAHRVGGPRSVASSRRRRNRH